MTHKVGPKGQVVVPKSIRDRLGLHPGTAVEFESDGKSVTMVAAGARKSLGGRYKDGAMASRLLDDRSREPR